MQADLSASSRMEIRAMSDLNYLRSEYPSIISSEQLRKILHVSKRKCAWMLQTGIIPCTDTHKRSRRYRIEMEQVIHYLVKADEQQNCHSKDGAYIKRESLATAPISPPSGFRKNLENAWCKEPDVLTIKEVAKLTGYSDNAVDRWIVKGILRSVLVQTGLIVCKKWLVDFYCGEGYAIAKKSEKHIRLIREICG